MSLVILYKERESPQREQVRMDGWDDKTPDFQMGQLFISEKQVFDLIFDL